MDFWIYIWIVDFISAVRKHFLVIEFVKMRPLTNLRKADLFSWRIFVKYLTSHKVDFIFSLEFCEIRLLTFLIIWSILSFDRFFLQFRTLLYNEFDTLELLDSDFISSFLYSNVREIIFTLIFVEILSYLCYNADTLSL